MKLNPIFLLIILAVFAVSLMLSGCSIQEKYVWGKIETYYKDKKGNNIPIELTCIFRIIQK